MSLLRRDTVEWNRRSASGSDAIGNPVWACVDGYPRNVRGAFQYRGTSNQSTSGGADTSAVAVFLSEWGEGKPNDIVSRNCRQYLVVSVIPRHKSDGRIDHYRYDLASRTLGSAPGGT